MVRACLPRLSEEEEALLFGGDPAAARQEELAEVARGLLAVGGPAALVE